MPKKTTRKEDAASIVGVDLAEEIEAKSKTSIHRSNALVEMSEVAEETQELIQEVETTTITTPTEVPEKSENVAEKFEDATMDAAVNSPPDYVANLPYGGATSMKDAENYVAARDEAIYLMDMWSVFSNVVWNIMDRSDVQDKRASLNAAVDEFKNVLTAKAMVAFSITEKSESPATIELSVQEHELQPAIDVFIGAVDNSLKLDSDTAGKLNSLNPALEELGNQISQYVVSKSSTQTPVPQNPNVDILVQIKELIQPLAERIGILTEDVNTMKSQTKASEVVVPRRIPAPRTLTAETLRAATPEQPKQGSLKSIIRKSVGLIE